MSVMVMLLIEAILDEAIWDSRIVRVPLDNFNALPPDGPDVAPEVAPGGGDEHGDDEEDFIPRERTVAKTRPGVSRSSGNTTLVYGITVEEDEEEDEDDGWYRKVIPSKRTIDGIEIIEID